MRRGTFLLVSGIAVPVVVLALGWWLASSREVAAKRREHEALLRRSADVVRGVVDASLEELRSREDTRPFDAYNYAYNPPGVVALSDALALSPLARDPEDKRVVGYFQIDKVGDSPIVKTPYESDPLSRTSQRARIVAEHIESQSFADLTKLATSSPPTQADIVAARAVEDADANVNANANKIAMRSSSSTEPLPANGPDNAGTSINELNSMQNLVYEELQKAEQEPEKQQVPFKLLPKTQRVDVDWDMGTRGYAKKNKPSKEAKEAPTPPPLTEQRKVLRKKTNTADPVVEYAPMVFDSFGGDLVLYRLVSSGQSRSVQGALLDRQQILSQWIPSVIERHVVPAVRPKVVGTDDRTECSLRANASDVLDDLELCFPPAALSALDNRTHVFEGGLLGVLVIVVGAAVIVTDRAARRADELSRQKGAFISAISHELRTPLTTLRMHAELLRDNLVGEDKRVKFHDDMVRESVRLSHLVENVLEATRLEEGRRPMRVTRGDLGGHVRATAEAQAAFLLSKGFQVDVDADEVEASFDRQAVEQIVVNLLDNGAKYSASNAADRVLRIEVRDEGGNGVLKVLDRGPGIAADLRERVFQRFYRVDRPGQEHVVGTGLGLALVRELAQAHGGTAHVEDRPGGGCCVVVKIPKQV